MMGVVEQLFRGLDQLFKNPAFTAVFVALLAIVANILLDRRSQVRWLADHFLSRKLDALSSFWLAVAEWHDMIIEKHGKWEAGTYDLFINSALAPLESSCLRALRVAQPFLEEPEFHTFMELTNRLHLVGLEVRVNPNAPGFQRDELSEKARAREWDGLDVSYQNAVEQMRELFGNKLLKRVTAKAG